MSASELEDQVLDADASKNKSRVDALLLGAIKNLKSNKAKPDQVMIVNLMYLAKSRPEFFLSNRVAEVSVVNSSLLVVCCVGILPFVQMFFSFVSNLLKELHQDILSRFLGR